MLNDEPEAWDKGARVLGKGGLSVRRDARVAAVPIKAGQWLVAYQWFSWNGGDRGDLLHGEVAGEAGSMEKSFQTF